LRGGPVLICDDCSCCAGNRALWRWLRNSRAAQVFIVSRLPSSPRKKISGACGLFPGQLRRRWEFPGLKPILISDSKTPPVNGRTTKRSQATTHDCISTLAGTRRKERTKDGKKGQELVLAQNWHKGQCRERGISESPDERAVWHRTRSPNRACNANGGVVASHTVVVGDGA
jgi:hypothetical protein